MLGWIKKYLSSGDQGKVAESGSLKGADSSSPVDFVALGDASFKQGKLTESIHHYEQALSLQAGNAVVHNKLGDVYYEQQDYAKAEQHYRHALEADPGFAEAELNLGLCLDAQGRYAEAAGCYRHVLVAQPENHIALFNLAVTLSSLGELDEAIATYRKVLALKPEFIHAHFNLATLYQRSGRLELAEPYYTSTLSLNPQHFPALCNLGVIFQEREDFPKAQECFERALQINPQHAETCQNLGLIELRAQKLESAKAHFKQALSLRPDFAEALVGLGDVSLKQNLIEEAQAYYRKAIATQPALASAYCNLGVILQERRQYDAAITLYQQGVENASDSVLLFNNMGNTYASMGRLSEAESCYAKALSLASGTTETYSNLAGLYAGQGKLEEAEKSYRKAMKLDPGYAQAYSNLLFMLNYDPDRSGEDIFAAYKEYENLYARQYYAGWPVFAGDKNRRKRLKIGYVSPDFCRHPVQYFLEPLMAHHDKSLVEIYAYAEISAEDSVTERYQSYADHWLLSTGMSDDALCQRIRADGIDILVDLAGHTANNRLSMFARKAAPVQVSWLGYGYTTGLSAIDYFLTDEVSAPEGSDALFAEHPWRLKPPLFAYRNSPVMGEVSPLPALKNGYVTIGTLTRSIRINYRTIRVWAAILKRLNNARLVIDSSNYQDANLRQALIDKFAAHGVSENQLDIGFHSPPWDTLRSLDIGLDCFPHNSGTTLIETLYMAVPFVTLAGRPSLGRLGSSILTGVGRPEWIAYTEDEYVEKVVGLASDIEALARIRAGLRQEMQNSPLMDEAGFTRKVEEAYQGMWAQWCDK